MQPNRRDFLRHVGLLTAAGAGVTGGGEMAVASEHGSAAPPDSLGVLVDTTLCVGCRLCEHACKKANGFNAGEVEAYSDQSVFKQVRRPAPDAFTVVNEYHPGGKGPKSVYTKVNCLHCNHPACASACIVGALRKQSNGAVTYEAWKCIGCRYCMVACPFQIPAYSYDDAFTPQVLKCQFCYQKTTAGQAPACVAACPRETMIFGKRSELLELAHAKIAANPKLYLNHVYGESEIGGTAWMYLASVPFEQIGFQKLGTAAPPATTEAIQHGVFKHGLPPLILYGTLGAVMWLTRERSKRVAAVEVPQIEDRIATGGPETNAPAGEAEVGLLERESGDTAVLDETNGSGGSGGEAVATAVATAPAAVKAPIVVSVPPENGGGNGQHHGPRHGAHHHDEGENGHEHHEPAPVKRTLLTPGVFMLLGLILTGLGFGIYRFLFGLAASTNLDQQHPWGLWIAVDVASGVALAAGGFTSAALTHVFHREKYHAIARPALLTAMLGYTFVVLGLQADLGRYYNVWHPTLPMMWQGNSVLFEVGMCVMCYLNVLYLEFMPIFCERVMSEPKRFPKLSKLAARVHRLLGPVMFLLVIAGCVLSCLHQSSLGNLMVIAPYKLHPLWHTPVLAGLFLLSAIAVGFPMVVWESLFASWSLKLKPEMNVLGPLARFIPIFLGVYLAAKLGDMVHRGSYVYLKEGSVQSICWMVEMAGGVVIPMLMLLSKRVRSSPRLLFIAVTLIVLGVMFNRINVFLIGYRPPHAVRTYFPSFGEFAVTIGLISCLMLVYRVIVTWFPVISQPKAKAAA